MKKHLYLFAVMLVSLTFILPAQAAEFKFTAIPDQDTARLQQRFDKVAAYLSKELGIQGPDRTQRGRQNHPAEQALRNAVR